MNAISKTSKSIGTILGISSLLFWSTAFAFSRDLSEQIGIIRSPAFFCLGGGLIACGFLLFRKEKQKELISLPAKYYWACGTLFVLNNVSIYLAIGLAATRQQVVEIGLINYLWPSLALLMSVFIFKYNARPCWLLVGILLASAGAFMASVPQGGFSREVFLDNVHNNLYPYVLALVAAISWALYSNLTRKLSEKESSAAISVFILASGLVLLGVSFLFPQVSTWSWRATGELVYLAVVPTVLGYLFWDMAMKKGDMILVLSLVYFNPLIAMGFSAIFLGIALTWNLWAACLLIIAGSAICKFSVREGIEVFRESVYAFPGGTMLYRHTRIDPARPSILFIHGLGDSGTAFLEAFQEDSLRKYNLIAPDLPGYGESTFDADDPENYSFPEQVKRLYGLLDHLGIADFYLVGHSMGGDIGTIMCKEGTRKRIRAFINIEGDLTDGDRFITDKVRKALDGERFEQWLRYEFPEEIRSWGSARSRYRLSVRRCSSAAFQANAERIYELNTTAEKRDCAVIAVNFEEIEIPKVFCWGDGSIAKEKRTYRYLQTRPFPHKLFKGSSHWVMQDKHVEFYQFVSRFFSTKKSWG